MDNEVEVPVRRDVVTLHTTAGRPARDDGSECNAPLLFTGTVMGREGAQYKADVVTEDGRLHGPMYITIGSRDEITAIRFEGTDGFGQLRVN